MKTVKAIIERGSDGHYSIYIDNDTLTYGVNGQGDSVESAKEDFFVSYNEMKDYYKEIGKKFEDVNFAFETDVASFLEYYSKYFSLVGLGNALDINPKQLSNYLNGEKKPRPDTIKKIEEKLHIFAKELSQVKFAY